VHLGIRLSWLATIAWAAVHQPDAAAPLQGGVIRLRPREGVVVAAGRSGRWSFVLPTAVPTGAGERWSIVDPVTASLERPASAAPGREKVLQTKEILGRIALFDDGVSLYATWTPSPGFARRAIAPIIVHEAGTGLEYSLQPQAAEPEPEPEPESVVFVLDASGSMAGERLAHAKKALVKAATGLPRGSDVALVVLYTCGQVRRELDFGPGSHRKLEDAVNAIQASGGTPLGDAMAEGFTYLHAHSRHAPDHRRIVVLTDGQSTCGQDPLTVVGGWNGPGTRQGFIVVGVDLNQSDAGALRALAAAGKGKFQSVAGTDLEKSLPRMMAPSPAPSPALKEERP
jgi:hypothetical protein